MLRSGLEARQFVEVRFRGSFHEALVGSLGYNVKVRGKYREPAGRWNTEHRPPSIAQTNMFRHTQAACQIKIMLSSSCMCSYFHVCYIPFAPSLSRVQTVNFQASDKTKHCKVAKAWAEFCTGGLWTLVDNFIETLRTFSKHATNASNRAWIGAVSA